MGLSVCSWMGGQRRDLISSTFEVAPKCPEDLSLSILAQRPHNELYPQKPDRREGRRVRLWGGQLGVKVQNKVLLTQLLAYDFNNC